MEIILRFYISNKTQRVIVLVDWGAVRPVSRNIENNGGFEMGVNSVNDAGSAYGAAFRNKPVYFMTGKETEAFFDGRLRRNMELREDTCTLSSNNTYRRQHTTYEAFAGHKDISTTQKCYIHQVKPITEYADVFAEVFDSSPKV